MGAVTLNLASYLELENFTLNLLSEPLTTCGLGLHPLRKAFRKLIAGWD